MIETRIQAAEAVCLDCQAEINAGEVRMSVDPQDLAMGVDIVSADGELIENCKKHHDAHRWGKKTPQHADFLIQKENNEFVGTVTVSSEGKKFTINSLNKNIRFALIGK